MAHFAKVENSTVTQVIVADHDFIDSGVVGTGWIQTSYNTHGGVHYGQDGNPDGGIALRKNYAIIGGTYDVVRDAFYDPQPYPSWYLDENTCYWMPPVPMPTDGYYKWDEPSLSWILLVQNN